MTIAELLNALQEVLNKTPRDQLFCPPLKRRVVKALIKLLIAEGM